jgi:tetratricopeptide (TPR) repeat protein
MMRQFDDAIPEYRRALELKPDNFEPHLGLGIARLNKGEADQAEAEFRRALDLNPDCAEAYTHLGSILLRKGRLDDAIEAYRRAIDSKPDFWGAHRELSRVLRQKGAFAEELEVLKRLAILSEFVPNVGFSTKDLIRDAEQRIQLDEQFSNIVIGTESLVSGADHVALASFAMNYKGRPALAVNWYREAFKNDPSLEHDMRARHRYNAARAAILVAAAAGHEEVADEERAMWLRQARDWLTADLEAAPKPPDRSKVGGQIAINVNVSVHDPLLAGISEPKTLSTLPEKDRLEFETLWREVRELQAKVEKAVPRAWLQGVEKKEGPSANKQQSN